jgi:hypothetical protein
MEGSDWAIIVATLLGPVLAVQAQKWIERATEQRRRKHWIFETLMASRAMRLSPEHVRALNQIELDFAPTKVLGVQRKPSKGDRAVLEAWRQYADKLGEHHTDEAALKAWGQRADDLFIELMHTMAKAMGYSLEQPQIRRGIYYPTSFDKSERRAEFIQDSLAKLLGGHTALKMEVVDFPQPTDEVAK